MKKRSVSGIQRLLIEVFSNNESYFYNRKTKNLDKAAKLRDNEYHPTEWLKAMEDFGSINEEMLIPYFEGKVYVYIAQDVEMVHNSRVNQVEREYTSVKEYDLPVKE